MRYTKMGFAIEFKKKNSLTTSETYKRDIRHYCRELQILGQLHQILQVQWNNMDQQVIGDMIESMCRKLQAVIAARVGNIQ